MKLVAPSGETVATLTNFACHPTVLDGDNSLVSSDYVSGFYQTMTQEALRGEHLFLQGAIGGWVQPLQGDHSIELARRLGQEVARASLELLAEAVANGPAELEFRSREFSVPLDNWGFKLMMWLGVLARETLDGDMQTEAAWFRIGGAQFVTHPGETSPYYSLRSRELMNASHTFVLGLTQDAMGYILKPEYFADDAAFPHGDYLISVSAGAETGPRLMESLRLLVNE